MFTVQDGSTPRRHTPAASSSSVASRSGGGSFAHAVSSDSDVYGSNDGSNDDDDDKKPAKTPTASPSFRVVVANTPSSAGARAIVRRQRDIFSGKCATVVSTDVQTGQEGTIVAVVLGTLSTRRRSSSRARRDVTFLHTFVLAPREGEAAVEDSAAAEGAAGGAIGGAIGGGFRGAVEALHDEEEYDVSSEYDASSEYDVSSECV